MSPELFWKTVVWCNVINVWIVNFHHHWGKTTSSKIDFGLPGIKRVMLYFSYPVETCSRKKTKNKWTIFMFLNNCHNVNSATPICQTRKYYLTAQHISLFKANAVIPGLFFSNISVSKITIRLHNACGNVACTQHYRKTQRHITH